MFASGGSEANDQAVKLVRYYWKVKGETRRFKIISRTLGYHGLSLGSTGAIGFPEYWQVGAPHTPGFSHVMAPYYFRCQLGLSFPECGLAATQLEQHIQAEGPETVAAVVLEPVEGAGGIIVPPPGYIQQVRAICDRYGILLIADEVICGFGRTDRRFGMEHFEVVPDVMVFAKGITSGYIPLGGVILSERIFREMADGAGTDVLAHGYTYSGHLTACAVALANLEIVEREGIVENARVMGHLQLEGFQKLAADHPLVENADWA